MPLSRRAKSHVLGEMQKWNRAKHKEGFAVTPAMLAQELNHIVNRFQWKVGGRQDELAACAVMGVYGPVGCGLPSDRFVRQLISSSNLLQPGISNQLAVERGLVFGATRPPTGPTWGGLWVRARETLCAMIRRAIMPDLNWLWQNTVGPPRKIAGDDGYRVDLVRPEYLPPSQEVQRLGQQLTECLLIGCRCNVWFGDFHIEERTAVKQCLRDHSLRRWLNTVEGLDPFLARALTRNSALTRGRYNEARYGMLVKFAHDGWLRAGYRLKCMAKIRGKAKKTKGGQTIWERCPGEILPDGRWANHCDLPEHHEANVSKPTFWFWHDGKRHAFVCYRCKKCGRLYYRCGDERSACPKGHVDWGRIPIKVYLPSLPIGEHAPCSLSRDGESLRRETPSRREDDNPETAAVRREEGWDPCVEDQVRRRARRRYWRQRLLESIESNKAFRRPAMEAVARAFISEGSTRRDAAQRAGMNSWDREFKRVCEATLDELGLGLNGQAKAVYPGLARMSAVKRLEELGQFLNGPCSDR
jgi:hypothetical protein